MERRVAVVRVGIQRGVALCVVVLYFIYLWSIRHLFVEALRGLRGTQVLAISGLLVVHWWLRARRDRLLFAAEGHSLRISALLWLNSTQLVLNYLPLKAGTLSVAGLLLTRFRLSIQSFVVVVTQQYLLNALAATALATGAIWFSSAERGVTTAFASMIFLGIALVALGLLALEFPIRVLPRYLTNRMSGDSLRRVAMLRSSSSQASATLALTLALCVISALRMAVVFGIVSASVGVADALVISALLMLGPVVTITPAGLGVTEALVGLAAILVGHSGQAGVVAATMDRAVVLFVAAAVSVATSPFTWRPGRES